MGHIKEPEGIDFIIKSKPLTDEERIEISRYIENYKANQSESKLVIKVKPAVSKHETLT